MKKIIAFSALLISVLVCVSQTVKDEYFKENFLNTASKSKAKYLKRTINYGDSILSVDVTEIETGKAVLKELYKNGEPFGMWLTEKHGQRYAMNYNFIVEYSEGSGCERGHSDKHRIKDPFLDDNLWNYKAPRKNEKLFNIYEYLQMNMEYPYMARKQGLEGEVILRFKISKEGSLEDITVLKGVHILLDKEAVRVLRLIKFDNPPTIGLVPQEMCVVLPFRFNLLESNDRFIKYRDF